jgi:hypothetical protein
MNIRASLRAVALTLVALLLLNAPVALWVYVSNPGLLKPDSTHTFSLAFRGGSVLFYTPFVGTYLVLSAIGSSAALLLLLFLLRRVLANHSGFAG